MKNSPRAQRATKQTARQNNNKTANSSLIQALHDGYRQLLRNSKYRWVVVLGTLLYLVSPLDISPDVFPIVGWIDDGLIATLLVTEVSQLVADQLKSRREQVKTATQSSAAQSSAQPSDSPAGQATPHTEPSPTVVDVEAVPVI